MIITGLLMTASAFAGFILGAAAMRFVDEQEAERKPVGMFEPREGFLRECSPLCGNCRWWKQEPSYCRWTGEAKAPGDMCEYERDDADES